jgi:nucleotide-binding universal stress UspA family protein
MYSPILVPIDDSDTAQRGLDEALALAQKLGSTLHVLHVVDARLLIGRVSDHASPKRLVADWHAAGERLVHAAVDRARGMSLAADGAVRYDPHLRVCDMILREAEEVGAGLIVMGTHGRRGVARLALGSDAEMVVRDSAVPVLLVRGQSLEGQQRG